MDIVLTVLGVLGAVFALVATIVLVRTLRFRPPSSPAIGQPDALSEELPDELPEALSEAAIERLAAAIRIPTISHLDYQATNFAPFDEYLAWLPKAFPLFCQHTELTQINDYALVYRWRGSDPTKQPHLLMAHYDVVPVENGTEDDWQRPPFSGAIHQGAIWGRGSQDIKSQMTAHMEAAEKLMREGFVPEGDLYFCYGHDEEVGGVQGAAKIVEYLDAQNIRFAGVLDEGGVVITGALSNVISPVALIGIAEKGSSNYHFEVSGEGGHSSIPPTNSALGLAARLMTQIEENPMPTRLTAPAELMLRTLSGEMGFVVRMAVANLWLFRGILLKILSKNATTNALVRTTCAVTMAEASDACNVLPQTARFNVNVRILPGDTVDSVLAHFEKLAARCGVAAKISLLLREEASLVSPTDSAFYGRLEQLIGKMYPSALISPYLVMGGTDSRQFYKLSDNVLRFTPIHITDEEKQTIHNTDERLSLANYARMISFYEQLLKGL